MQRHPPRYGACVLQQRACEVVSDRGIPRAVPGPRNGGARHHFGDVSQRPARASPVGAACVSAALRGCTWRLFCRERGERRTAVLMPAASGFLSGVLGGASPQHPHAYGLRRRRLPCDLHHRHRKTGLTRRPQETATGRFWSCPEAQACSSTRSRKVHTRALSSRASKGGIIGGGSMRLGAKTTVRLLSVMRF